jgi:outer membrane biosynthesis protein TonB
VLVRRALVVIALGVVGLVVGFGAGRALEAPSDAPVAPIQLQAPSTTTLGQGEVPTPDPPPPSVPPPAAIVVPPPTLAPVPPASGEDRDDDDDDDDDDDGDDSDDDGPDDD